MEEVEGALLPQEAGAASAGFSRSSAVAQGLSPGREKTTRFGP